MITYLDLVYRAMDSITPTLFVFVLFDEQNALYLSFIPPPNAFIRARTLWSMSWFLKTIRILPFKQFPNCQSEKKPLVAGFCCFRCFSRKCFWTLLFTFFIYNMLVSIEHGYLFFYWLNKSLFWLYLSTHSEWWWCPIAFVWFKWSKFQFLEMYMYSILLRYAGFHSQIWIKRLLNGKNVEDHGWH